MRYAPDSDSTVDGDAPGVDGAAAGAGFSLALACDMIVAGADAKFVMAYVKVGLTPDGGASWFLSQALPRQLATEIIIEGKPVKVRVSMPMP